MHEKWPVSAAALATATRIVVAVDAMAARQSIERPTLGSVSESLQALRRVLVASKRAMYGAAAASSVAELLRPVLLRGIRVAFTDALAVKVADASQPRAADYTLHGYMQGLAAFVSGDAGTRLCVCSVCVCVCVCSVCL